MNLLEPFFWLLSAALEIYFWMLIINVVMSWLVVWVLPGLGLLPELPNWANFWLLALLVSLVYIPVTFWSKPDDLNHLVRYYVMARPLGFWGPVRKEAIRRGMITG